MPRILISLFLVSMLCFVAIKPPSYPPTQAAPDEAAEIISFAELPAKDGDDFRYCVVEIKSGGGTIRRMRLKAKKALVAESIGGFAKNMLPW